MLQFRAQAVTAQSKQFGGRGTIAFGDGACPLQAGMSGAAWAAYRRLLLNVEGVDAGVLRFALRPERSASDHFRVFRTDIRSRFAPDASHSHIPVDAGVCAPGVRRADSFILHVVRKTL